MCRECHNSYQLQQKLKACTGTESDPGPELPSTWSEKLFFEVDISQ